MPLELEAKWNVLRSTFAERYPHIMPKSSEPKPCSGQEFLHEIACLQKKLGKHYSGETPYNKAPCDQGRPHAFTDFVKNMERRCPPSGHSVTV